MNNTSNIGIGHLFTTKPASKLYTPASTPDSLQNAKSKGCSFPAASPQPFEIRDIATRAKSPGLLKPDFGSQKASIVLKNEFFSFEAFAPNFNGCG
jgi:hypothetical protein